jgi:hypothetical protein
MADELAAPPYPHPIPAGVRPQIKSISAGSFSGAGQDWPVLFTVSVETCEPDPTVQVDAADIEIETPVTIENNKGTINCRMMLTGMDPGIHLVTVTDANGVSDAVQIFLTL